jgi:hypothetical protein
MSAGSGTTATNPKASSKTSPQNHIDSIGDKDHNHETVTFATDTSKTSTNSFKWPLDKVPRKTSGRHNRTGMAIHVAGANPASSKRSNRQQGSKIPDEHSLATARVDKELSTVGPWKKIMPPHSFPNSKKTTTYRSSMLDGRIHKKQRMG